MGQDLSKVWVNRKEVTPIVEETRKRLVALLKEGKSREEANKQVSEWLVASDNALSPYATEVVDALYISDTEIEWRKEFGDAFCDLWAQTQHKMKRQTA